MGKHPLLCYVHVTEHVQVPGCLVQNHWETNETLKKALHPEDASQWLKVGKRNRNLLGGTPSYKTQPRNGALAHELAIIKPIMKNYDLSKCISVLIHQYFS